MLNFLIPKTKLQAWSAKELPIELFEIIGIAQINPYCKTQLDNQVFFTLVNFSNDNKNYDEREGLVLSKYFTLKKCPKCKKIKLMPTKLKINMNSTYIKHEEEIAFDAFEEIPSRKHISSIAHAFCNHCSSCFELKIKLKDCWIKEAKKLKEKDLVTGTWNEYCFD